MGKELLLLFLTFVLRFCIWHLFCTVSSKEGKQRLPYDVPRVFKLILLFLKKYYFSGPKFGATY